jgi:DNA-binding transcriptional LysR family regulator
MQQFDLIDLRSFITVVECGSFVRAADRLGVSTASISRRVGMLEEAIGTQLIVRTTRRLDVTDAGRCFYADAQNVFQLLDEAQDRARAGVENLAGILRVAAPLSFGIQKLAPALPGFLQRHPDLKVQLLLEDRYTDLQAESIDVAIRIGLLEDSSLIATRIGTVERIFVASPSYLARHDEPTAPEDLRGHACLNYSLLSVREEWSSVIGEGRESGELYTPLAVNNAEVLREAAIQGLGITLLPRFAVRDALQDGRLRQILHGFSPPASGLYAVRLSRQFTPARLRVFIEFLREVLGDA